MKKSYLTFIAALIFISTNICAEEIIISGNAFKPPKIWQSEDEKSKGILVDIMHYAGKELGVVFKIELFPWKRAYMNAVNDKNGIVGISKTKERLKIFDYSEPLYFDEVVLVVKRGSEFKYEKNEDLKGKIIGACRGCSFGPEFEEAKKYFEILPDNNNISRLTKLLYGRIDAAIISPGEAALNHIIKYNDCLTKDQSFKKKPITRAQFSVIKKPITKDPNYLAFSKNMKMKDFLLKFNEAIRTGYKSGKIQKIISGYNK